MARSRSATFRCTWPMRTCGSIGWAAFFSNAIFLACGVLCLGKPLALNLNVHMNERNRRRSHAGNTRRVAQRARTDALQLFIHLTGKAADLAVIKPVRDHALLG